MNIAPTVAAPRGSQGPRKLVLNIAPTATAPRGAHAPAKVADRLEGKSANYVSISWDPTMIARDRSAGFASVAGKDGAGKIAAAWTGTAFALDTVMADASKADVYERSMIGIFTDAVARNEAGLSELKSNLDLAAEYKPKNGTFDFVFDRPGTGNDLRYVGLIEAAPTAIRDILEAATGFRKHF
ncbi:MAG: hypothetical protein JWM90_2909 [Thermoleophilia bacterium]|nr:hypothetical protein [Thermoleophilia bacterium]